MHAHHDKLAVDKEAARQSKWDTTLISKGTRTVKERPRWIANILNCWMRSDWSLLICFMSVVFNGMRACLHTQFCPCSNVCSKEFRSRSVEEFLHRLSVQYAYEGDLKEIRGSIDRELRKLEQRQQRVAKKEVRSSPISLGRGNNIHWLVDTLADFQWLRMRCREPAIQLSVNNLSPHVCHWTGIWSELQEKLDKAATFRELRQLNGGVSKRASADARREARRTARHEAGSGKSP